MSSQSCSDAHYPACAASGHGANVMFWQDGCPRAALKGEPLSFFESLISGHLPSPIVSTLICARFKDHSILHIRWIVLEAEAVLGIITFCDSGQAELVSSEALL